MSTTYSSALYYYPKKDPETVLRQIKTVVNPMNREAAISAESTISKPAHGHYDERGSQVKIKERTNEIKLLTYNVQLIPSFVVGDSHAEGNMIAANTYPCGYQDERVTDMFRDGHFDPFDIVCIQECFEGLPGQVKELTLLYAQKAGFMHVARGASANFGSAHCVCGGHAILSRFPIKRQAEHVFSYQLLGDAEAACGVMYAEILIDVENESNADLELGINSNAPSDLEISVDEQRNTDQKQVSLHLFTTQLMSTNLESPQEEMEAVIQCRITQLIETHDFIKEQTRGRPSNELIMIAGDFNINATPLNDVAANIICENSSKEVVKLMDKEYDLAMEILSGAALGPAQSQQMFKVNDLVRRDVTEKVSDNQLLDPGKQFKEQKFGRQKSYFETLEETPWIQMPCTYGDSYIDSAGDVVPLDTVLTPKLEWCTRLLVDYILHVEPLASPDQEANDSTPKLKLKDGSTVIEKFMAKPGRPYTQLADHYGISTIIELADPSPLEHTSSDLNQSSHSNPQTATK